MAAPGTYPVPPGRGRWRLTLHRRDFGTNARPTDTGIAELTDARSRKLVQALNQPATLSFTLDGRSPAALSIQEMSHDVIGWRFDDQTNKDVMAFRGIIAQSQDTLSEQAHTVAFTAHDYLAMLKRRLITGTVHYNEVFTQVDQDTIASNLVQQAVQTYAASVDVNFYPGCALPLGVFPYTPAGVQRGTPSGQKRDRTYPAHTNIGDALDQLAKVINGFDYDCWPTSAEWGGDSIRIFYPYQGVQRSSPQLVYGSTVSTVTRNLDSADYANYQRTVGNNGSADPAAAQKFGEAWNSDSNNITVATQGLWMTGTNAADVTIQQTLTDKANGDLGRSGLLQPHYAVGLRPGAYSWGNPNMGDVVPLIIQSGRLNVNTTIRVVGITYDIGDDGAEDVQLVLGRPDTTIADIFGSTDRDVDALARR
jgi:hypothetical protein